MDRRLVDWARTVKARHRRGPPPLWLFTDARRLPDPRPAAQRLPPGLAGIVFRHDEAANRLALGMELARICRARGLALVVAGDVRLANRLRAGVHLRDGRHPGMARWMPRRGAVRSSSAHGMVSVRRAWGSGADLVFISPVFSTLSHPGAPALGPLRWARLARHAPGRAAALGGLKGAAVMRLGRGLCVAAGAIGGLAP